MARAFCELWQVLANLHTVGIRRDGFELSAMGVGRIGFQIKRVHVARATAEADEDCGLRLPCDGILAGVSEEILDAK